jgi:hypothetical protein
MPQILTDAQAADAKIGDGTRYSKEQWTTYLKDVAGNKDFAGKTIGGCQADFPGVKPAHVRHMFRQILKDDATLAKRLTVATHETQGICLKVAK